MHLPASKTRSNCCKLLLKAPEEEGENAESSCERRWCSDGRPRRCRGGGFTIRLLHWTLSKFHWISVSKGNTSLASDIHPTDKNPCIFWKFLEMTSIWCQYLQLDNWPACSACLAAAFSLSFSRHMEGPAKHQFQQETWRKNLRIFQWLTSRGLNISDFCQSISCKAAPLEWACVFGLQGVKIVVICVL